MGASLQSKAVFTDWLACLTVCAETGFKCLEERRLCLSQNDTDWYLRSSRMSSLLILAKEES